MHGQTLRYELKSPTNWNTSSCIVCQVLLIPERALLPKPRTMVEIHFFVSLFLALCQWEWSKNRADEKKTNKETSDYILNWSTWHKLGIRCPTPCHVLQFTFDISLPSFKKTPSLFTYQKIDPVSWPSAVHLQSSQSSTMRICNDVATVGPLQHFFQQNGKPRERTGKD